MVNETRKIRKVKNCEGWILKTNKMEVERLAVSLGINFSWALTKEEFANKLYIEGLEEKFLDEINKRKVNGKLGLGFN